MSIIVALWSMLLYAWFFRSPRPPTPVEVDDGEVIGFDGAYVIEPLAPNLWWTLGTLAFLVGAVVCFVVDVHSSWLHSLWHMFAAGFLACLAEAVTAPTDQPVTVLQYELVTMK